MPVAGRKRGIRPAQLAPSKIRKRDSFILKQTHDSNVPMKSDAASQTDYNEHFGPLAYFLIQNQVTRRAGPDAAKQEKPLAHVVQGNVPTPCHSTPPKQPHRIHSPSNLLNPISPASALAQLRISARPTIKPTRTGASKSCRRLNPSQSINQATDDNKRITDYFPVRRSNRKTKNILLQEKQEDIKQAIRSQKDDGLQVLHFGSKGRGVVATRLYQKGDFVVEYAGDLIDVEEAKRREKLYAADQNTGCYMYYFSHIGQQYCVDATKESTRIGRLINHSRVEPNLHTKTFQEDPKLPPHLILIARRDIHPGEELLYDYGDRSKDSLRYHPWLAT